MSPPRPYRIAGAVKVRDPASFDAVAHLAREGRFDGLQVYVKGPLTPGDRATIGAYASLPVSFAIHAPHHEDGVNPVEPTAPGNLSPAEGTARLEAGMAGALEAADLLDADRIVFHAGCVVKRNHDEALAAMDTFFDDMGRPAPRPREHAGHPPRSLLCRDVGRGPPGTRPGSCLRVLPGPRSPLRRVELPRVGLRAGACGVRVPAGRLPPPLELAARFDPGPAHPARRARQRGAVRARHRMDRRAPGEHDLSRVQDCRWGRVRRPAAAAFDALYRRYGFG